MDLPSVSFLLPTLNAAGVVGDCLRSIRAQDYPPELMEIVVADGGSSDETLAICRRHTDRFVPNPLRTAEAGKAAALRHARHDVVALVDSDNVLPDGMWLRRMVAPFRDDEIVGSEPLAFTYRRSDPVITRYCALMGMNDPLCFYLGNYDRLNAITGQWTDLPVRAEARGGYLKVWLEPGALPTIGANGTLLRRSLLERAGVGDYLFDVDVLARLARARPLAFAKVETGIVHLFADGVGTFLRKQRRRVTDYLYYRHLGIRDYPWEAQSPAGLVRFVFSTVTLVPLLAEAVRGWRRVPDPAWAFHPVACWATLIAYSLGLVAARLPARGGRSAGPADRTAWRQTAR